MTADAGEVLDEVAPRDLALSEALTRDEFVLFYQPVIRVATGEVVAHEALARWLHPEHGLVGPDHFLAHAEASGFILPLGDWVLKTACAQSRLWDRIGKPATIAVNISPRQLFDDDLVDNVANTLIRSGVDPSLLVIEITEHALLEHMDRAVAVMAALQPIGVRFSLDDFCTGYSSLSHLDRLRFDHVKIDRSFVAKLDYDKRSAALLSGICQLCRSIDLETIAEGIETQAELECVRDMGVTYAQGYFVGMPGPALEWAAHRFVV